MSSENRSRAVRGYPFQTRGVVLIPEDLSLGDWPERAATAGLTTVALHAPRSAAELAAFVRSPAGERFLAQCAALGLQVEYELHAMRDLLPRGDAAGPAEWYRMDEGGERRSDWNLCPSSPEALEHTAERAAVLCDLLRPTTHRYFLWGDDGRPWCRCPRCRDLSDSDQSLLVANGLLAAIRTRDPEARVAWLSYLNTLEPPGHVQPAAGVFLEYAPIRRCYEHALDDPACPENRGHLEATQRLLALFPAAEAHALEYWLDASRFSRWRRPAVQVPLQPEVLAADLACYARLGFGHVTTFACWLDAGYRARWGEPPVAAYGAAFAAVGARPRADSS